MSLMGSNCDLASSSRHDRFSPYAGKRQARKKGLDLRDRITEGIEAARPRRDAARFTRAHALIAVVAAANLALVLVATIGS
jgi:hypothetical protein